ncbi:hypothetical protein [Nocardiopsis sp. FR26]|uniref:hypothetical protein n=1 Tax=Nocardiopsis sp. FR26 TaxID=2605987 RepID=UPI00135703D9|nr:hypothetical protein [Nocardiopsis sp. FR26]
MFRTYNRRPETVEGISITNDNLTQAAQFLTELGYDAALTEPNSYFKKRHIVATLPRKGGGHNTLYLYSGRVLLQDSDNTFTIASQDEHDHEYALADPTPGANPGFEHLPKVAAAVKILADAGHQPALLVSRYGANDPAHSVTRGGFLVLSFARKLLIRAEQVDDPAALVDAYTAALEAEGYTVKLIDRYRVPYLAVTPPE